MNTIIEVEVKSVYGTDKIYPANTAAEILCKIAGTKTLSKFDLSLAAELGLIVKEINTAKLAGVPGVQS